MSFKRAPREDELDTRHYQNVAPISDDVAKFARGTAVSALDRAHREAMERAKQVDDKELQKVISEPKIRADYKIEVTFGPKRTTLGPNVVHVRFFESGSKLNGGGDDMMFICRNPDDERQGCGSFIPPSAVGNGIAMCPGCKRAIKGSALTEYLIANFTTRRLAKEMVKFFNQLKGRADLYCKYDPSDIRYLVMVKKLGAKRAHELRGMHIYPLSRILKDTNAGADLENRFFAFLTA